MKKQIIVPNVREASVQVNYNHTREKTVTGYLHIHPEYELTLCNYGQIKYILNNTDEYILNEGDVIFINRNTPHITISPPHSYYIPIIFDHKNENPDDLIYTPYFEYSNDHIFIPNTSPAAKELKTCILAMKDAYKSKYPYYTEYIKADMQKLIAILLRYEIISDISKIINSNNTERFLPVMKYVNHNYMKQITLDEVSSILHVDKFHFCRLFKSTFNFSFIDYINSVRIFNAERLLVSGEGNISEIAQKCGFSTPEYFGKIFKKYKKYTPSAYKKLRV